MRRLSENPKLRFTEVSSIEACIGELDILYMTRIQRERFSDKDEYERLKDFFVLDKKKLKSAKKDMMILHPLPRVNEIAPEVDEDKRASYFLQAQMGFMWHGPDCDADGGLKVKGGGKTTR